LEVIFCPVNQNFFLLPLPSGTSHSPLNLLSHRYWPGGFGTRGLQVTAPQSCSYYLARNVFFRKDVTMGLLCTFSLGAAVHVCSGPWLALFSSLFFVLSWCSFPHFRCDLLPIYSLVDYVLNVVPSIGWINETRLVPTSTPPSLGETRGPTLDSRSALNPFFKSTPPRQVPLSPDTIFCLQ